MDLHFVAQGAGSGQGVGHQLRAQGAAADADQQQIAEAVGVRRGDALLVDVGGEGTHLFDFGFDCLADGLVGGELGGAKPVVADHAVFVGVGDGPSFQAGHRFNGGIQLRLHLVAVAGAERDV